MYSIRAPTRGRMSSTAIALVTVFLTCFVKEDHS